jgi:Domain of unknown function (DUF3846)
MKKYFIKTEQGFFKDIIEPTFTANFKEAHRFVTYKEANSFKKALDKLDGIQAEVFEDDPELQNLLELAKKYVDEAEANAAANPSSSEILVVVVEPGRKPYKKVIPNELEVFKDIVGGWIENLFIGSTEKGARVGICLNEEGKLIGLPFNRRLVGNHVSDVIVGSFFITAYNMEGDNVSLTDQEAEAFIRRFKGVEVYI